MFLLIKEPKRVVVVSQDMLHSTVKNHQLLTHSSVAGIITHVPEA